MPGQIECSVCLETYSLTVHVPKSLPCGHTFCKECLCNLHSVHNSRITCPKCKKKHKVHQDVINSLGTNYDLLDMLEYICSKCHSLGQPSKCAHCQLQLCLSCLEEHIQSEYLPEVESALEEALKVNRRLRQVFPAFVRRVNTMMDDCDVFISKTSSLVKQEPSIEDLIQIHEQSLITRDAVNDVRECVFRERRYTSPTLSCLNDVANGIKKDGVLYSTKSRLVSFAEGESKGILESPTAVAVDDVTGKMYVISEGCSRIFVLDKAGSHKSTYRVYGRPVDVCIIENKFIAVTCYHEIKLYNIAGFDEQEIKNPKNHEVGVAKDDSLLLYAYNCDDQSMFIWKRSGSVTWRQVLDTSGPGKLEFRPMSVAVHPQTGQFYVAVQAVHNPRVNIYGHDGKFEASIGKDDIPGVSTFRPVYLSFRRDGLLCISDTDNSCIHLMKDGIIVQSIGSHGCASGNFGYPCGSTFTTSGDLVVCDKENDRLQIFSLHETTSSQSRVMQFAKSSLSVLVHLWEIVIFGLGLVSLLIISVNMIQNN